MARLSNSGPWESGTLTVESDYFSAVNLKFVNSAPRPDGKREGAQAVAMKIAGDYASFYNCRFHGFQDTLCDDRGKHFFKDCYVEGTVDFIFGSGQSLYVGDGRRRNSVPIQVLVPLRPVIYAYSQLSEAVHPQGWSNNAQAHTNSTVYFGEYHNEGPGSDPTKRATFAKQLSDAEVKPFLSLAYIEGGKWLLPPAAPRVK
ncbi:UNVERIFIED_CONTAM: Pectinesterase 1 [Sesamum radiatum]|uniref:Pectinesterase n=1 Tax=Sesamum radiatum TaxID=300843 RepID=A0AAW2JUQ9_SESRA